MRHPQHHDYYLDELLKKDNLTKIGEDKNEIAWVLKDGLYLKEHSVEQHTLCDLILVYYQHYAIPIELKSGPHQHAKAFKQISAGVHFIEHILDTTCPYAKIIYYNTGTYQTETIPRGRIHEKKSFITPAKNQPTV